MKSPLLRRPSHLGLFLVAALSPVFGQSIYIVSKSQVFTQTSSGSSVADPITPFLFSAEAPGSATLALPSGSTVPLPARGGGETGTRLTQSFATKTDLDAAFPNGTYRITATGIPTLTFNLTSEAYPATNPAVINGTWSNGVLVVNPAQATALTFSTNTSYGGGNTSHMSFELNSATGNNNVDLQQQIATQAVFGLTQSASPFTSFTIPANTLANGGVYEAELDFDTLATLDTTSVPGGGAVSLWQKALRFFVVAQAPGSIFTPPSIPTLANVSGVVGGSVTISLPSFSANPNTVVEWYFNGQRLNVGGTGNTKYTGQNFPSLTINNLTAADVGSYQARIVTAGGLATSSAASLTLATAAAPLFTSQPSGQPVAISTGSTVVLSVTASGAPAPSIRWQRDGVDIPGATSAVLVLSGPTAPLGAIAGSYRAVATNSSGSTPSNATQLNVVNTSDVGRLVNLSILTQLTAGEKMTMGTVIRGSGGKTSMGLLARAVGPTLGAAPFGIPGVLPDPKLTLISTSVSPSVNVASNNHWGGTQTLINAFNSVGAFAFMSATSNDSAVYKSDLSPGNYTVDVSDAGTGTGTVIAELYDTTPSSSFSPNDPRLINVSVLKQINPGDTLTAGFVLKGATARTVMIRAVGPTLASNFGLGAAAMADPQLKLFRAGQEAPIATNNDWGGDAQIATMANNVGAFSLVSATSKDAVILVTLPANGANYTAQVTPVSTGGLAIVEVYEVP